jgi:hypothetical protein
MDLSPFDGHCSLPTNKFSGHHAVFWMETSVFSLKKQRIFAIVSYADHDMVSLQLWPSSVAEWRFENGRPAAAVEITSLAMEPFAFI